MPEDLKQRIVFEGAEQAAQSLRTVADAQDKVVAGADKSAEKTSFLGGKLNEVKAAVTGMVGAWLGLKGVEKIFDFLIERLEIIRQYQKEIAERGLALRESALPLATKLGDISEGGQAYASKISGMIQKAGFLKSTGEGMQLAMAASDLGYDMTQAGNVKSIGRYSAIGTVRGMTIDQQIHMLGMLSRAGVRDVAGWSDAIAKISGASGASGIPDAEIVAAMAGGGSSLFKTFGMDNAVVLATMAAKNQPGEQAARTLKALTRIAGVGGSGGDAKMYAQQARMMGLDWKSLSAMGRVGVLERMFGGSPDQVEKIKRRLGGDQQAEDLSMMFSASGLAARASAWEGITTSDAGLVDERIRQLESSTVGYDIQKRAGAAINVSDASYVAQQLIKDAEAEYRKRKGTGNTRHYVSSNYAETNKVILEKADTRLVERVSQLQQAGKDDAARQVADVMSQLRLLDAAYSGRTDVTGLVRDEIVKQYTKGENIYIQTTHIHGPVYNRPDPVMQVPDRLGGMQE